MPWYYEFIVWVGGPEGKYFARGQDVRTERNEVCASRPIAKYFTVLPDLTQSISILSCDHWAFLMFFFRGCRRGSPFRAHFEKPMVARNLIGKPVVSAFELRGAYEVLKLVLKSSKLPPNLWVLAPFQGDLNPAKFLVHIAVSRNFTGNVYEGLQQRICTTFLLESAKTKLNLIEQLNSATFPLSRNSQLVWTRGLINVPSRRYFHLVLFILFRN